MSADIRSYGGWRERRGFGLAGLSGRQTAAALGAVLVLLAVALVRPGFVGVLGIPLGLGVGLVVLRVRDEALVSWFGRHGYWVWNRRRGWTTARTIDTGDFPGVLAGLTLLEVKDAAGLPVGLTWDQKTHSLTAVIPVQPFGLTLVGAEQVSEWVSGWGDWLSHLGYLPALKHVVVTVHTGPSPPTGPAQATIAGDGTVVQEVIRQLDDDLEQPGPAQFSRTLVSITVDVPDKSHLEAAGTEVVELCGALGSTLGRCGVSVLATMTPHDIVQWLRAVYEPTLSGIAASANWADGRPTCTEESWAHYQHDGAVSAAYVWDETPGQRVPPDVLARLLGPSEYHKRVSLVYEPMAAHIAVREVDRQAAAAAFRSQYRRRLGRDETAKERADLHRAEQTATDQVGGAGLVDVGLYAVATASDTAQLRRCTTDLENRAGESRIRLRRNYGAQAATFASTTAVGFVPRRGL
jgi:hypothetical protein